MQRHDLWLVWLTSAVMAAPASAQIDYRNLDDDRPTHVEDATSIERYAFELILPYGLEREKGGGFVHAVVPELAYGLLPNFHLGIKVPMAVVTAFGAAEFGISGLRTFALYNFNTEGAWLPATALRVDGIFPVGEFSGSDTWVTIKAIATRSFGLTRAHVNGAVRVGPDGTAGVVESPGLWWAGVAVDRTLFRQSILVIGEMVVEQEASGAPLAVNSTVGLRVQWSPTSVIDLGVARGWRTGLGPEIAFAVGFSHVFGVGALIPGVR